MCEVAAAFAGWEPPREATETPEEAAEAIRAMGGAVLPSSALPEWVRESYAHDMAAAANQLPVPTQPKAPQLLDE